MCLREAIAQIYYSPRLVCHSFPWQPLILFISLQDLEGIWYYLDWDRDQSDHLSKLWATPVPTLQLVFFP